MVQIQRVALPDNATFYVALGSIFGLGRATALTVSEACGIGKDLKVGGWRSAAQPPKAAKGLGLGVKQHALSLLCSIL